MIAPLFGPGNARLTRRFHVDLLRVTASICRF
jgi:hypothetical protein